MIGSGRLFADSLEHRLQYAQRTRPVRVNKLKTKIRPPALQVYLDICLEFSFICSYNIPKLASYIAAAISVLKVYKILQHIRILC